MLNNVPGNSLRGKLEDTKEVIRSRKSKDSQTIQWPRKAQKTKDKQNLQNNSHKYEDSMTRTPLKTGADSGAPKRSVVPAPQELH